VAEISLTSERVQRAVNTIRMLSLDAVERAKCGHPGMPMGAADYAFVLWTRFLRYNPRDPAWPNRDRFVLSAGHGCMLLYSLLHLTGYDVSLEDLKNFRQLHSKTPGHPEFGATPGVEATTGPLGQGFANGVGMAIAAKKLAARFNTNGRNLVSNTVYAMCSDGDMMEGISHEAASLAGHLGLDNLIYYYDDNHITIEGKTDLAFSEDVGRRFEAYGWHVQRIDGHDRVAIEKAIRTAQEVKGKPKLIIARTHIGWGSPKLQDTSEIHGAAIGPEETKATKRNLGWPLEPDFYVPDDVRELFLARPRAVLVEYQAWREMLAAMRRSDPDLAAEWDAMMEHRVPDDIEAKLLAAAPPAKAATRNVGGKVIQVAAKEVPALMGGSADLHPSTKTFLAGIPAFARGAYGGRNMHFGVREHAMGAIMNGMAYYGGFIPYGSTFLVFADYMRPAIRVAAISRLHCIYVFTHDSIFVGEDGPTHQAVEQMASLRAMPNLVTIRPGDAPETAVAWAVALRRREGPTALFLTRQDVPPIDRQRTAPATELKKGGYILLDAGRGTPQVILIASGSELPLAVEVREALETEGVPTRVVSMPSMELFDAQEPSYREQVLPPACTRRVIIEAAVPFGWHKYGGLEGLYIGMTRFGTSGKYQDLAREFGFTKGHVLDQIHAWLRKFS